VCYTNYPGLFICKYSKSYENLLCVEIKIRQSLDPARGREKEELCCDSCFLLFDRFDAFT
jgi:hypothetical protein